MVKGVTRVETWITQGDEYGVYRITEGKHKYLMFAFDEVEEARNAGKTLAKLLKVSFRDHIYSEPKLEEATSESVKTTSSPPSIFAKPKKVMEARTLCSKLFFVDKLPEEKIKEILVSKYIEAGHREVKAKQYASYILREIKKQGV